MPATSTTGSGYDPGGTILNSQGRPLTEMESADVRRLLRVAALCGEARVEMQEGRWHCVGDPTEGALLVLASKGGVERAAEERSAPRVGEFPFESQRQRMSTLHLLSTGAFEVLTKGSPESILPLCKRIRENDASAPLTEQAERDIQAEADSLALEGLRVLAFARREISGALPETARQAETEMEFLGLVGMSDPVRPEVPDAVARCRRAGIRVVMITGDHPATAMTVAREAGLSAHTVVLGSELPDSDEALGNLLATHDSVLARISPEDKLRIARALQGRGEVVAMTGDGVNDAPALRQADIGVAMGKTGTDVAREAADLVLLDDNFAHIVEAVEEGRAAFDNIKRFLTYHLTDNVAELTPFVLWALSAGRIPLMISVLQVLALDVGTDLLPALALGAERPEPGVMDRPPRPRPRPTPRPQGSWACLRVPRPGGGCRLDGHAPHRRHALLRLACGRTAYVRRRHGNVVHDGLRRHREHADGQCIRVPIHPGIAVLDRPALQPAAGGGGGGGGSRPGCLRISAGHPKRAGAPTAGPTAMASRTYHPLALHRRRGGAQGGGPAVFAGCLLGPLRSRI